MRYIFTSLYRIALVAAALAIAACNDNPSTIGAGYLPQNVKLLSYAMQPGDFDIVSGNSVASNSSAEGGSAVLVGRAPGVVAHGLLAITSENPLLSGAASKPVKSARLVFRTGSYRFGDTATRQMSFDVVVLDEVFSSKAKWTAELAAKIENATAIGSYTGDYLDDTSLIVTLDPAGTQKYLQEYFRYDDSSSSRVFRTLKSLALRSRVDGRIVGALDGISGVAAANQPLLSVTVIDGSSDDSTVTLPIGTTSWICDQQTDTGAGKIVLAGGSSVRTRIKLRLDSIPPTAAIHGAELRLTLDTQNCRTGTLGYTKYLVGYLGVDSSLSSQFYMLTSVAGVFPVNRMTGSSADSFTNVFRFTTLAPAVSSWLRNARGVEGYPNQGVILAINRGTTGDDLETTTVDRYTFHGAGADPLLRPTITIYYSLQSDAR